jgi:hypothetical protein
MKLDDFPSNLLRYFLWRDTTRLSGQQKKGDQNREREREREREYAPLTAQENLVTLLV